jgi:hypothetical protein
VYEEVSYEKPKVILRKLSSLETKIATSIAELQELL